MRILRGRRRGRLGRQLAMVISVSGLALATMTVPSQVTLAASVRSAVTGVLTSGGHTISGATVILYAWPRQAVLDALPKGADVPLRVVGSAISTSTGQYAITVSNWKAVRASADGNVVNLEVRALSGRVGAAFFFPRMLVGTTLGPALAVDNEARHQSLTPQQANLALIRGPSRKPPGPPCPTAKVKWLGKRWTTVGITASKVNAVKMSFNYASGQNSSLGVGFSATDGKGSWSQNGTMSVTESGTSGFTPTKGKVTTVEKTKFKYWKFENCLGFYAHVTGYAGGTEGVHVGVPRATHCDSWSAGSKWTKSTTTAWKFSGGVGIAYYLGINLSSQTGYSTTASITWHFGHHTFLCGKNDDPGGSPGIMVAGLPGK